ncbi:hypothetical protein FXV77_10590 [Sphingobacterium phlebotomi]|uniref:Endosialidase-like protein n=1 Tax=Sphingobacterium phlebotomi TaxID=2605433 RepID=A0A5D4H6W6_9SPHI|nr:hypothetical protein [Sphingobacterium phlebotomi]TYR36347.1 hypothetical protein FXV77_10590 [Sphingobacterium phlebotomi]
MSNCFRAFFLGLLLSAGLSAKGQSNVFPTSGNVGIGTSNPMERLHVRGDVRFQRLTGGQNYLAISADGTGSYITANDPGTNMKHLFIRVSPTGEDATDRNLYFQAGKVGGAFQTRVTITGGGNVGIGTNSPKAKLAVEGNILAKEIKVTNNIAVPDYVFEPDYKLTNLSDIETYVKEHKHLPEIPSAKDIDQNGLDLGEMNLLLLKKVEELTLHLIEKEKKMDALEKRLYEVEAELASR